MTTKKENASTIIFRAYNNWFSTRQQHMSIERQIKALEQLSLAAFKAAQELKNEAINTST
jgi:hypothetical protein